jgi:A/G-specific adenine glycosylase
VNILNSMMNILGFNNVITIWFSKNKRNLPWRNTKNPYKIWVSEIILQQTRVIQGIDYYKRFIRRFKNIQMLAHADIDEVLKLWQGLGYYSRARNMHAAANQVLNEFGGKFPDTFNNILKLKGVGKYTAAAIASICFDDAIPAIDGNAFRVISRYKGIHTAINSGKAYNKFYNNIKKLMGESNPGTFNQALMEIGAIICTPLNAKCTICPIKQDCVARKNNLTGVLPVRLKTPNIKIRYFNYFVFISDRHIILKRRNQNDIWKMLYDFPLIETNKDINAEELLKFDEVNKHWNIQKKHICHISRTYFHKLTHQEIRTKFYLIKFENMKLPVDSGFVKVGMGKINSYPVPTLIEKYLSNEFGNIKNMHYL